jgi:hypothetical protein
MMMPTTVNQEPGTFSFLADKYGHPQWVRLPDNCGVGPDRVAAVLRADKYGHVLENTPWEQPPDSSVSSSV